MIIINKISDSVVDWHGSKNTNLCNRVAAETLDSLLSSTLGVESVDNFVNTDLKCGYF